MRSRLALLACALVLPIPLAAVNYGCNPKAPSIQDFCGFLRQEDNCYLTLINDMGNRCGVTSTAAEGAPSDTWGAPKGFFSEREKLDVCILEQGGSITFDPPLSIDAMPPAVVGFAQKDAKGATCGTFRFENTVSFTLDVSPTDTNGDVVPDAGPECDPPEAGANGQPPDDTPGTDNPGGALICGGNFISEAPEGDFVDTTCGKEEHHFISSQLEVPACAFQKALLPRFELDAVPGGVDVAGHVRFRVFYPQPDQNQATGVVNAYAVAYFDCAIPAAAKPCCNGAQDGLETDIDCGGPTSAEIGAGACDRCQAMQGCVKNSDCASNSCIVNPDTGIKQCNGSGSGSTSVCNAGSSSGGTGGAGSSSSSSGAGGAGGN